MIIYSKKKKEKKLHQMAKYSKGLFFLFENNKPLITKTRLKKLSYLVFL